MAAHKFLTVGTGGNLAEEAAVESSAGAADEGKIPALNSSGQIDATMLPGADQITIAVSEAIAAGALINLWNSSGTIKARNADNTAAGKECHGFAPAAIASGSGLIYLFVGTISGLSALTVGGACWLGAAGAITQTLPTGAGVVCQSVGVAATATSVNFHAGQPIVRA